MDSDRMNNADMIQYCDEALAWEDFGFVDRYFFESVKKILLGECSAVEKTEDNNICADTKSPVTSAELEPEYKNFPDEYYTDRENNENVTEKKELSEDDAFSDSMFSEGFFVISPEGKKYKTPEKSGTGKDNTSFTVKI